jgi:glycosyltransferase involved in cell wall biosynthesis
MHERHREARKGWDILLRAYLEEFKPEEEVALFIKTSPFHDDSDQTFPERILKFAKQHVGLEPDQVPAFSVVDFGIPQEDLAKMYKSADAFVLPHRGEGWGRPHAG